jgi:hypothetical protein
MLPASILVCERLGDFAGLRFDVLGRRAHVGFGNEMLLMGSRSVR